MTSTADGGGGRATPELRALVVVLLVALALVGPVHADGSPPVRAGAESTAQVSPNWSGYVASGPAGAAVSFTRVTGSWRMPTARCSAADAGALAAIWVGLGGYASPGKLEQVGTDVGCDRSARPVYWAWFEVVPYPAYSLPGKVLPGDLISASVEVVPGTVVLRLDNATRGWTATRRISWPAADTRSAEWIVEAPGSCLRFRCAEAPLADFDRVTIRRVSAVGDASTGTLATRGWKVTALRLVPGGLKGTLGLADPDSENAGRADPTPPGPPASPAGAEPGPVWSSGRGFTVTWLADAAG